MGLPSFRSRITRPTAVVVSTLALVAGTVLAAAAIAGTATGSVSSDAQAAAARANARSSSSTASSTAASSPYVYIHDPTMAKENGNYYVFSTGDPAGVIGNGNIQIRTSRNLKNWTYHGTVFATIPTWITSDIGSIPNLWAPDISYFDGLWHLYYAGSSFGSNNSVIGLATTPTLDPSSPRYHWTDDGLVFRTVSSDDYNAIDPSLVTGANGSKWLVLGSYWSGIKLIQLDAATGKPESSPTVYSLAEKATPDPEEGAGIVYHDGYYYLFVSVGTCCRGISSTYHIQVGRSASITGPYADAYGTTMLDGGGTDVQGTDAGMVGPGGEFVFNPGDGQLWLGYHYYDAYDEGDPWLQIRPLIWLNGWPVTGDPMVPVPGQDSAPGL
jgi:arabinan endo-1,5-alpha-L-arabinosidase